MSVKARSGPTALADTADGAGRGGRGRRLVLRVGLGFDRRDGVPQHDLSGAGAQALAQVEVVAERHGPDRTGTEARHAHGHPAGERCDGRTGDEGGHDERHRAQDGDPGPPRPVAVRRRGRSAEREQEQVEQAGPGDRPAARGEAEDDRGGPQGGERETGQRGGAEADRDEVGQQEDGDGADDDQELGGSHADHRHQRRVDDGDALARGGEGPVQRVGVGQHLEAPGRCPVPDEDDADGDDGAGERREPTRTGSPRGRRSRPRRRRGRSATSRRASRRARSGR